MGRIFLAAGVAALTAALAAALAAAAAPAVAAPVAATATAQRGTLVQIRPALSPPALSPLSPVPAPTGAEARQAVIGTMAEMLKPGADSVLGGLAERLPGRAAAAAIDPTSLPLGLARITAGNQRLSAGAGIGTQGLRGTLALKHRCASLLPTELSTRLRLSAGVATRAQAEWQSCPGEGGWSWGLGSAIAAGPGRTAPGAGATAQLSRRLDFGLLRTQLSLRPNGDKAAELSLQLRHVLPLRLGLSTAQSAGRPTHKISARLGLHF